MVQLEARCSHPCSGTLLRTRPRRDGEDPTSGGRGLERGVAWRWPGLQPTGSVLGRVLEWGGAVAPRGAGGGGGVERSAGEGTGGRPRGGTESPDRRLPPAVGPCRASAPVSGSGSAGCCPSVLPGGQRGSWRAAARAWLGRRAALCLRAARALRASRVGAALHRAPRAASCSASVRGQGRAGPGLPTTRRSGLSFVAAWRTFRVALDDHESFVFVSGSARANTFSFF